MVKYQQNNPNNCRVSIDFNSKDSPVKFEYVGKESAYTICRRFFRGQICIFYYLVITLFIGVSYGLIWNPSAPDSKSFSVMVLALVVFMFYTIPACMALLFSRVPYLLKKMPYLWSIGNSKFYVEFKPEDIKDNKLEIPLFGNVFLAYKLDGDFVDKIDKLEIIEHPFNQVVMKQSFFKKSIRELKPNEFLWKAEFTFTDKPKDGYLGVTFT